MIKWLNEWWKETKRIRNSPNFIIRKGGVNDLPPVEERPPPPKGQNPKTRRKIMDLEKLNKAIEEAAKKLVQPFSPAKYSGDYKYWSGLHEARKLLLESNGIH